MKKIMLLALAILVLGSLSFAGSQTFTGTVSDSHCGAKHSAPSKAAEQCVEHCVSGGASYVLVSNGKVYQLKPQEKFKGLGGKSVTVTGTAEGDVITVASVKAKSS